MSDVSRYGPPAVVFQVVRSTRCGLGILCVWCVAVLGLAAWMAAGAGTQAWRFGVAAGLCLGAGGMAWHAWAHTFVGALAWDGARWSVVPAGATDAMPANALEVHGDFQRALCLSVKPLQARRTWVWAERRMCPERWDDLRRAVYSPPILNEAQAPATGATHGREA